MSYRSRQKRRSSRYFVYKIAFVKKSNVILMDVINPIKNSVRIFSFDGRHINTIRVSKYYNGIV
jgi:hypothetical protein